eukprot:5780836-Prymnesium_polylepis.2
MVGGRGANGARAECTHQLVETWRLKHEHLPQLQAFRAAVGGGLEPHCTPHRARSVAGGGQL